MSKSFRTLTLSLLLSCSLPALAQAEAMFVVDADSLLTTGSVPDGKSQFMRLNPSEEDAGGVLTPMFRRLASDAAQLRFDGEMGTQDLPVYLRADQIGEPAKLRIKYLSAVSVMPEASRMMVSINGRDVAAIALDAANEAVGTELDVPQGLLKPGYNSVRFTVQQRHRVDCTIEAANELWTKVDLAGTGFALVSNNDQISAVDQLVGMPPDETGAIPISVVVPAGTAIQTIDMALRAAQALAMRGRFVRPRISFVTEPGNQPGIQLFVGTSTELRAQNAGSPAVTGASVHVEGRSSGTVRVYVTGDSPAEVATAITRLASEGAERAEDGTPEGLQALKAQRGVRMSGDSELTFSDLGLSTQEFNGRLYRTSFNIVLPPDFYPADNGKATLYLDGEYIGGLLTTNEALVSVNGKVSGASRLTRSGGETISRRPIAITLRALHPGHNTITLEVRTSSEGDRDCNPLSLIDAGQRLRVTATSSFALPSVARMEHLPNLGALTSTGYPLASNRSPVTLYMPKPSHLALGAAATLIARTAMANGRMIETQISRRLPDERTGAAVIVGTIGDLPEQTLNYFGVRKDILPKTWRTSASQKAAEADIPAPAKPVARVASLSGLTRTDAAERKPAAPEPAAPAQPAAETAAPDLIQRASAALSRFLQRNVGFSSDQLSFLTGGRTNTRVTSRSTVLLAEQQAMSGGSETWLLLTGPDAGTLQADVAALVSPPYWHQVKGRMAAYDPSRPDIINFPAGSHYHHHLTDKSIGNVTLVTAGWLSNNIMYYVLVILTLCGVFGIVSRTLLNRIGVKP